MRNIWLENVGIVRFVRNNVCLWMAPSILINGDGCVTSPIFRLAGRNLRIVKMSNQLYLWNVNPNPSYDVYIVTLSITKVFSGFRTGTWVCKGETNLNDGFGDEFPCNSGQLAVTSGCIKIYCKVEKKVNKPPEEHSLSSKTENKIDDSSNMKEEEEPKEIKVKGVERLTLNLKNLLTEGHNSDMILKAENREFRVHKGILGARSPVFASMFQLDMKEKTSGVVDIPDCTAESFEVFLLYLYTGAAETMSTENVSNLYYAADKYRVDDLKEDCIQFMKDSMSVENICDVVALSLRHSEAGLLKEATNFFRKNIKKIIKTVKWQIYMQENSTHANELLVKALDA